MRTGLNRTSWIHWYLILFDFDWLYSSFFQHLERVFFIYKDWEMGFTGFGPVYLVDIIDYSMCDPVTRILNLRETFRASARQTLMFNLGLFSVEQETLQ